MKLFNVLGLGIIAGLVGLGCSSTVTDTSDGGPDSGSGDTGVKTDTGTGGGDTGTGGDTTPTDTGSDAAVGCGTCANTNCKSDVNACVADAQCSKDVDCVNACAGSAACDNFCVTNACGADAGTSCPSADLFNTLITCLNTSCHESCFGKP